MSPPYLGSCAHAVWRLLSYPCDNDDRFSVAMEGFGYPRRDLWCEGPWQLIGRSQLAGDLAGDRVTLTSRETTFDPLRNLAVVPVFFALETRETFSPGW